jgi:hypothetical protein
MNDDEIAAPFARLEIPSVFSSLIAHLSFNFISKVAQQGTLKVHIKINSQYQILNQSGTSRSA